MSERWKIEWASRCRIIHIRKNAIQTIAVSDTSQALSLGVPLSFCSVGRQQLFSLYRITSVDVYYTDSSRQKKVPRAQPCDVHAIVHMSSPQLFSLPVEINVVDGILEGDLDLLPHHGGGGLGGGGHTAGGSSDGRGGGGRCGLKMIGEMDNAGNIQGVS